MLSKLLIMKSQINYVAIIVMVFITSCSLLKTTPEIIKEVTQKVHSKDFDIAVNYVNPMGGRQLYLNSDYDLRIKNDSAFAYLPYFGIAYSTPYGGEGGIKFAEPMKNYSVKSTNKSDGWNIRFKVKAKENDYEIFINIFNSGSAMINVNSINRQPITFDGELKNELK
jgi:hypothetical protein